MVRRINSSVLALFALVGTVGAAVIMELKPANMTEALSAETPGCYLLTPALAQTATIPKQPSVRLDSKPLASEAGHATGKWKLERRVDKMTDAELLTLTVRSEEGRASLRLVCSPSADGNPMLHFLLVVPEDPKREYTLVSLRFDKKEQEFDLAKKVEQQILLRAMGGITGAVNYWLQTNDPNVVGTAIGSGSSSAISKDVIQANSHRLLGELTNASRLLYQFSLVSDVPGTEGTFDVRAFSEAFKPMAEKGCRRSADQKQ